MAHSHIIITDYGIDIKMLQKTTEVKIVMEN